ncbi:hypothetical protein CJ030_MR5G000877 [Morella rubra]|uniref:Uncharacterized protein n=1 Tax=Morella rubra TaxID=262757 RepID=A0A6A1VS41_9ROSI|nr:hypothetical protein CJ030_MR5G000877 [Morella rubra]
MGLSNDPVERKLTAKLNLGKRKAAKSAEESTRPVRDGGANDNDDEEDLDSRTSAFANKRAAASRTAFSPANKKQK